MEDHSLPVLSAIERLANDYVQSVLSDCLVLYAGANVPGPRAASLLGLPLGAMPAMGQGTQREQPGVAILTQIEAAAEAAACQLFQADWAEVRLPSCTIANLALYSAVCEPGDLIAVTPRSAGGHVSHQADGAPAMLRLNTMELPFDNATQAPDDLGSAEAIRKARPKLVMLGASLVTRDYDFPAIRKAATEVNAVLAYDVAHVAGLIAANAFPNPLHQGADLLTMSTYKSLGGAPGGIIVGKSEPADLQGRLRQAAYPWITANYDAARVASMAASLADISVFGVAYVGTMLANARALQSALATAGFIVAPSTTHHLALPLRDAAAAQSRLEACGILCGTIAIRGYAHPRALRIGTQLLTRRGFEPSDMSGVAQLVTEALRGTPDRQLQNDVATLARSRRGLVFCHQ